MGVIYVDFVTRNVKHGVLDSDEDRNDFSEQYTLPLSIAHSEYGTLIDVAGLSRRLCVTPQTVVKMVETGELPPPMKIENEIYWTELTIERWWALWLEEFEDSIY